MKLMKQVPNSVKFEKYRQNKGKSVIMMMVVVDEEGEEDEDEDEEGEEDQLNRGARAGLKHRAWRSSCRARHSVERDMSSELRRRGTFRICSGVSVTAVSISAKTSLVRRLFSGWEWSGAPRRSCLSFVLMLSSDQSGRIGSISRGFSALLEPSQRHDPWCTEGIKSTIQRLFEQSSAIISIHHHHRDDQVTCTRRAAQSAPDN